MGILVASNDPEDAHLDTARQWLWKVSQTISAADALTLAYQSLPIGVSCLGIAGGSVMVRT